MSTRRTTPVSRSNLITTPDRPSYMQKLETLAAADQLPELFDTDATPFAQKLADQGRMVDAELLLEDLGLYDAVPARWRSTTSASTMARST